MMFYTGNTLPEKFASAALIAENGGVLQSHISMELGYRVQAVGTSPDGSVLISDEYHGAIYRLINRA